ncbi:iron complex transport system ATP-binding protein [Sporomusaceae bacterium BoRhaA]|uniref:ABC transporter ATP-binding protein n=1 Tax=Pelorhabdus rhamnosifermentans TaxID=2772457 RepID=UPI001C060D86|nr:ABC transporter ATP-binding protein [Pelorhabdus rhamnosifermentans]MBU2702440.1 iron complex transport system ATP-binding protein [Pelorhabdus rhamnosifermentans]
MHLEIENATFSYDGITAIFSGIHFAVDSYQVFCLLGPNGTGKSTLIQCLNRLLPLSQGIIRIDGKNIDLLSRQEIARKIAYVPQTHVPAFPFSVLQVVLMGRTPHLDFLSAPGKNDILIAEQAMDSLGIFYLRDKCYTEISGGERQLVLLAAALAQDAKILILDEPTSHLDFGNQIRLLHMIDGLARQGRTVIMSTHFPDHALLTASNVAIMKNGRISYAGPPETVITEKTIYDTYGIEVAIGSVEGNEGLITCVPRIISSPVA